jgi:hypothetical protein
MAVYYQSLVTADTLFHGYTDDMEAIFMTFHYQEISPKTLNTRNCEQPDRCNLLPNSNP